MNSLLQFQGFGSLKLSSPVPLTQHPAGVYLAGLGEGSQRTMRQSLNVIASLLTNGECDALTLDWAKLRYRHTAAIRAALLQRYDPATAAKMLCALRRTLKEAWRLELMEVEDYYRAVDLPRIDAPEKQLKGRALSSEDVAAVMEVCQDSKPINIRDLALVAVLKGGGMRREEVVNLELLDYNRAKGALHIRKSKRGKDRTVYLPKGAISLLEQWLEIRGKEPGALLCPVRKGGRVQLRHMTPDAVLKIMVKRTKQAEIEAFSPHDFRRTFCSDLIDAGIDIVTVQKLMGHASPVTTAKYDRRGEETKRKAVERLEIPYTRRG
ncbi:site-specific integrase [Coleofasciculus sp. FACHB-501]|uniref:tyrosine-type recombinase/integrase n=1 Tax=Cyanophyceae TaxID=3028117 RepID=UPI0016886D2E|nr:site-specific integrase [Coleofasciculus sp. FACHB-501]MBD1836630.1 site-specific integrase [Coleofasciculus sp. FACHB-501]